MEWKNLDLTCSVSQFLSSFLSACLPASSSESLCYRSNSSMPYKMMNCRPIWLHSSWWKAFLQHSNRGRPTDQPTDGWTHKNTTSDMLCYRVISSNSLAQAAACVSALHTIFKSDERKRKKKKRKKKGRQENLNFIRMANWGIIWFCAAVWAMHTMNWAWWLVQGQNMIMTRSGLCVCVSLLCLCCCASFDLWLCKTLLGK